MRVGFLTKVFLGLAALLILAWLAAWKSPAHEERTPTVALADGERRPVVVELFTSEGCSSCPPADRLLIQLDTQQPVPGAEIIVLGWHVDYWNRLGWVDAFSSEEFTARQYAYADAFGLSGAYTPQMVVDGSAEFIGSDAVQARKAIARAALAPKGTVRLQPSRGSTLGEAVLGVSITDLSAARGSGQADVWLVVTENDLGSNVQRGENAGRRLEHRGVVRYSLQLATLDARVPSDYSREVKIPLVDGWKRENLRAVVFVQDERTHRILGAASVSLAGN